MHPASAAIEDSLLGSEAGGTPEGHWYVFKENKAVYIESETGKCIPTEGNKLSTGCEDSLSLSKEVSQAQGPFLCDWVDSKGYTHEAACPNAFIAF